MIITIDGPAGSGKSTVARLLAGLFGIHHLNTGALFRALTAHALHRDLLDPWRESEIEFAVKECEITCHSGEEEVTWSVDGTDVTGELSSLRVHDHLSQMAALPAVRAKARIWQREWAQGRDAVIEGRDAGSSVFKDAAVKVFLTAALEARAQRRWEELESKGQLLAGMTPTGLRQLLAERDRSDEARELDPLVCLPNAVYLDTTDLSALSAAQHLYDRVRDLGILRDRG